LGIPAIVFGVRVRKRISAGDIEGPKAASQKNKMYCLISFGLSLAIIILRILMMIEANYK